MTYQQILIVISLVTTRSFTATARELFLTQPTVTHHVKALEKELGVTLFDRTSAYVVPTKAGEALYEKALDLRKAYLAAYEAVRPYSARSGRVVIGCHRLLVFYDNAVLEACLGHVERSMPHLSFETSLVDRFEDGVSRLLDGSLDFLIGDTDDRAVERASLERLPIMEHRHYACVSRSSQLADRPFLSCRDLEGQTVFLYNDGIRPYFSSICAEIEDACGAPLITKTVETYSFALPRIERGEGVTISPLASPQRPGLAYVPLITSNPGRVGLLWRKEPAGETLARLSAVLAECLTEAHGSVWAKGV